MLVFLSFAVFSTTISGCVGIGVGNETECRINHVPSSSDSPISVGEIKANNPMPEIWINPGDTFQKIVFRIWKFRHLIDFLGGAIQHRKDMELDRKQLNLNISSANKWTPIRLEISQNRTALSQQTYRLKAFVNGHFFEMDTKIGIRIVTIKRVEILVEGEAEVAIGCQPRMKVPEPSQYDSPDEDSDLLKGDSTPLGYPFWVASLAFMAITSATTVVIAKYCKASKPEEDSLVGFNSYQTPQDHEDSREIVTQKSCRDVPEYHLYNDQFENIYEEIREVPLSASPKLIQESHYVEMNIYKNDEN